MAKKTASSNVASKSAQASTKKKMAPVANLQQTHAALPPVVNMNKLFGIDDGYLDVSNLDEYKTKLAKMTVTDLHDHCHLVGIVPLEQRDKLLNMLEKKYLETKASQIPPRVFHTPVNPKFADFHRNFCADSLK